MGQFDRLYAWLPSYAQHAAVSGFGAYWHWLRFGPGYKQFVKEYVERERFTGFDWQVWQRDRLANLLETAALRVPYYQRTWNAAERRAALAGRLDDLPLTDKDSIRVDPENFLREDKRPRRRIVFHTSGSTGTPIATIWTVMELRSSIALREVRSARWAKVSFQMPRATFSGRLVEPNPESKGPFYRFNLAERQVYLSAFHLRPETAASYVHALRKHRVKWLTGYAVSYYLLARMILEQGLTVPPLSAVITTSEKVTPEMRRMMEEAYRCRVYEEYSTVENSLFASECDSGRLHVSPDAGLVEILREDGTACGPGEVGKVVATCLLREYQIFVRYPLGDLAAWDPDPCPCGRNIPVLREVLGRIEDLVVGPDGRQMVRFHGIFVDQPKIREGQIIQETTDRIRVKIVPAEGFGQCDSDDVIHRVQQRLGVTTEVVVELVGQIPRTAAGKFQAVISLLKNGCPAEGSNSRTRKLTDEL